MSVCRMLLLEVLVSIVVITIPHCSYRYVILFRIKQFIYQVDFCPKFGH